MFKLVAKDEVDEIMPNYSNISLLKEEYFKDINNEVKNREITKQKLFNESKLRINRSQNSLVMNPNWTYTDFKVNF